MTNLVCNSISLIADFNASPHLVFQGTCCMTSSSSLTPNPIGIGIGQLVWCNFLSPQKNPVGSHSRFLCGEVEVQDGPVVSLKVVLALLHGNEVHLEDGLQNLQRGGGRSGGSKRKPNRLFCEVFIKNVFKGFNLPLIVLFLHFILGFLFFFFFFSRKKNWQH